MKENSGGTRRQGQPSDCEAGLTPVNREGKERLSRKALYHHAGQRRTRLMRYSLAQAACWKSPWFVRSGQAETERIPGKHGLGVKAVMDAEGHLLGP